MSELIESRNRIKILSAGVPIAPNFLPLAEIPLGEGPRHVGDLGELTYHPHCGSEPPLVCSVVLLQSVYKKVNDHLSEDTKREHGGFLLGFESTVGDAKTPAVVIVDAIAARFTEGSPVRLIFTTETWRDLDEEIAKRHGAKERAPQQVGWYHSHPNIRIFLSTWDLDVCTTYARRQYPVALVVDPINDRGGFFVGTSKGYDPQAPQGFYEAHDLVATESVVTWNNMAGTRLRTPKPAGSATQRTSGRGEDKHITIRMPSKPRLAASLWQIGFGMTLALLFVAMGILFAMQQREGAELEQLKQSLAKLPQPASPQPPQAEINITPAADQNVFPSQQVYFAAEVEGIGNKRVVWSIEPQLGTISSNGVYKAPREVNAPATVLVTAASASDASKVAVARVHLQPSPDSGPSVSIAPAVFQLGPSKSRSFHADITGTKQQKNAGVKWTTDPPGVGTEKPIKNDAKGAIYTAPSDLRANRSVTIIATSVADPSKSARATITLVNGPASTPSGDPSAPKNNTGDARGTGTPSASESATLEVVATKAELSDKESEMLKAVAPGGAPAVVTWTLDPGDPGSISAQGVYTAPDHIEHEGKVTVTAKSNNGAAKPGQVVITLKPSSQTTSNPAPDHP